MPLIESIRTTGTEPEQLIARVRVDRTEVVRHGDVFPHFAGRQYYSLGNMQLIDHPDGEWKSSKGEEVRLGFNNHMTDTRVVEVIVRPIQPGTASVHARLSSSHGRRRKSNGILPHEPFSSDKAAE